MRSLADIVSAEDFAGTNSSEYLETVLVAVPKSVFSPSFHSSSRLLTLSFSRRNLTKEWDASYERLTAFVVPRSSVKLAEDDEFVLFSATIFKRVREEYASKCREKKCVRLPSLLFLLSLFRGTTSRFLRFL
jgi:V-type H+-transporting ATPase subunit C